jgi:hypothetical protein
VEAARPKSQFVLGNRGYREICHRNSHQTAIHGRTVSFDNTARDIRVQKISARHQNNSRFLWHFIPTVGHELLGNICFPPEFEEVVP